MKLNRIDLRRLIESVINEENPGSKFAAAEKKGEKNKSAVEKAVNQAYNQIAELNPLSVFKSENKEIPVNNIIIKEVKKEIEKPSVIIEKEQVSKKQYYIIAL